MAKKDDLKMKKDAATLDGYVNPYAGQIQELYQNISNRQPFQYDVDSDAMYQALKDQYVTGGKLAMMDTMGQAAQLTGGYGNSYAQGVGQQAYQGYLQGLNDQLPDLYNMALQNYIQTGDAMLQEYGMLQDMAADDYRKYQDQMALVQPQVLEMLAAGVRPSDEMIAASGLSKEYINAMFGGLGAKQTGGSGNNKFYVAEGSDWFQNNLTSDGWINTADGKRWLNTREGQRWLAGLNGASNADEGKVLLTGILNDPDKTTKEKRDMLDTLQGYK